MKNLAELEKRRAEAEAKLDKLLSSKQRRLFSAEINRLLREVHNAEISINQVKQKGGS